MFITWMDGSPKKTFSAPLTGWQWNCSLHRPSLRLVITFFLFVFFPNVPSETDPTDLERYHLVGPINKDLPLLEMQKCSVGQSKAMISGLWNCDLSLLPVCRIDLTGWHSAFWTSSGFWAYRVIFVMTRKALFLSLLFLHPIPYSPLSGSKICVQSPDKVIWGRSSRRGDDVPSHPVFADRFCPLTSSLLRYDRDVGEKNACRRPQPGPFLQACGTQTVGWRKLCLSNHPIVVGKVTLALLFLVAQSDLKIFSLFLRFRRNKRCHFVLFFWFYECLSDV